MKAGRGGRLVRRSLSGPALPFLVVALVLGLGGLQGGSAQGAGAAKGAGDAPLSPARLLKGPNPVKGLPFFGQNALSALYGEYAVGAERVPVWSCRETVWLSASWKPTTANLDTGSRVLALEIPPGLVLAFQSSGYRLFVELPEDRPTLRRFAAALDRRFAIFFQNAPTDAELSFPAYIDFKP